MARHGAPPPQLALQVAALAVGAILAAALPALSQDRLLALAPWAAAIGLALLGATLLGEGLQGIHRWIGLGPIRLHASSLASPVILLGAAALLSRDRAAPAGAILAAAQLLHLLQPDAGQATALAAGAVAALLRCKSSPLLRALLALALAAAAAVTWTRADPLVAVPIVEGIVRLAGDLGRPFQALAVAALAAIPLALAITARRAPADDAFARARSAGLAAYVTALVLVPIVGNFPVPVLGFGVSPILGVAIALGAGSGPARGRARG